MFCRTSGQAEDTSCCETILVRDAHYAGRRFDFGAVQGLWSPDEPQVALVDENGKLLKILELDTSNDEGAKKAA